MTQLIKIRALALKFLGLAGLFIILSSAISADSARSTQQGFRYSEYLTTLPDAKNANNFQGSFIVQTQPTDIFHTTARSIYTEVSAGVSDLPIRESILDYLIGNKGITYNHETIWRTRGWNVLERATNRALFTTTESARRTGLIRTLELDVQSELGGRSANVGLNALGGFHETKDDVVAWQLRGYRTSEESGANAGLIYRRATENNLLAGANVFLDYETHDVENFWRYSIGGELRSPWVDIFANKYIAITDPVESSEGTTYTAGGHDVELNVHSPDISWLTGKVTYYNFNGEFGDEDEEGVRFGLKFFPRQVPFVIEIEYEDADEGDESIGGRIYYTHEFGAPNSGNQSRGGKFTPRDWFYAPVEREYTQRIRTGGGVSNTRSITLAAQVPAGFGVRIFILNTLNLSIVITGSGNEYIISDRGERGVTLQMVTISMISPEQPLVWPIPTEQTIRLESDTPLNVSFLNGVITSYIGSTVIMGTNYIGLLDGRITVATGGGSTGEFIAFQGGLTTDITNGVIIDLSEETTVSFSDHLNIPISIELFAGNPTFIIDGIRITASCGTSISSIPGIAFRCPIADPIFSLNENYISETFTSSSQTLTSSLLRVESTSDRSSRITYLENRHPRVGEANYFARLVTVNGGSGNRITYGAVGTPNNIRVNEDGEIYLINETDFPRGRNQSTQLAITITATDPQMLDADSDGNTITVIPRLTVIYRVDVNSQNIIPFTVNLLGAVPNVPENGNTIADPVLITDARNGRVLTVANISTNGGILRDILAGDANYLYERLDSAGNVATDNTPIDNLNLIGSQIIIPQITEQSEIAANSILGITVRIEDIADAAPNIPNYTNNYILTLFIILGLDAIRTDPIEIQFTPSDTYETAPPDNTFRYTATGNRIRINYPYSSQYRSQSTTDAHRNLGKVAIIGGSGRRASEIQSSGGGIDVDIAQPTDVLDANGGTSLNIRIPANTNTDTDRWTVRVTASDPFIQSSRTLLANETAEYIVDAVRDIGGVTDSRDPDSPGSLVQRNGALNYSYFTVLSTLGGITTDYPHSAIQLTEPDGGRGSISSRVINIQSIRAANVTYNPATRAIGFANTPAVGTVTLVIRFTDDDSSSGAAALDVSIVIDANNDLINIGLSTPSGDDIIGTIIRTTLLNAAEPRGHIANVGLLNVTDSTLVEDPNRSSSLEYDANSARSGGAIFAPDNQFAGGIIDYANEVVRHSLFVLATDNNLSVTVPYVILAELGFDTPVPSPLGGTPAFEDTANGIRYRYNGDHDNGISIRVNYPYDGNWAAGSTDTQRAFINIGGEISVLLDSANQAIFAHDETDGVIRVISETAPTDTTDAYIFNYVPYSSAKGLNGITNTITFLAVEDIGGVTDEVALAAPSGGVVRRSSAYNYRYFIALSTLNGITTYPHPAIQLGEPDGGSGNISSRMLSSSDSRVTYNASDRLISFRNAPAVEDYNIVIEFTDDERSNNGANIYLVTVSIVANNDLINVDLSTPSGDDISGNVIRTTLLNASAPRGYIASIGLLDTTDGTLIEDPNRPSSLEYDSNTDRDGGAIFSPDNQFAGGVIDYDNEVVRHSLFVLATDNELGITLSYEIFAELGFDIPVPSPLGGTPAFEDTANGIRYAYSGDHDNGISIRVNYPYDGNWAAGSTDVERSFINIGGEISVFLDPADQSIFAHDETDGVIRVVSETAPTETTDAYILNYVPYSSVKGLNGITNTITFLAVEDIGGVTDLVALAAPSGSIVRRDSAYNYEYFIALSTLNGITTDYPHPAIQLGEPDGGSGNISSRMLSSSDSRVTYNASDRLISFRNAPAVEDYNIVIEFTDDERSNNGANIYLVTVSIVAHNDLIDIGLSDLSGNEINGNVIRTTLLDAADPRSRIANIEILNITVGTLVEDPNRPSSLEYDSNTDRDGGAIFVPDNQFAGGIIDYANEVVRHSLFVLATDNESGVTLSYVILAELGFDIPIPSPLGGINTFADAASNVRYAYSGDHDNGISIRVNYPYDGNWAAGSTDTQRAFINIGGEISVFLDSTNQTIFAYDGTDGVIRLISETPPTETTDSYIFNYVPYSSAKGLNGITNEITFLGVEDVGGVTDEVAADAPTGNIVQRSGVYNYGYFIALSTLGGITTNYPHNAIQLGGGDGGSGNISSSMESRSDSRVVYNPATRIISFASAPAVANYEMVIRFTDDEASTNEAVDYLVTVNILANNDLVDIALGPVGISTEINSNVISTPLLDVTDPRGHIANITLLNVPANGVLEVDTSKPSSLEYDRTDITMGRIFSPDNQFAGGVIDYANEVVRHSIFINGIDNDMGLTISYEIRALLSFETPVPAPLEQIAAFANPASNIRYAYSGDHDNGISIRVNYPYNGNWAAGSTDAQRSFINIGGEVSVLLDGANQAVFAYDDTDGVIRVVSETAPADTTAPYTFNYVPYSSAKGLNGITNTIIFLGVEDIGGVTDEVAQAAPAGGIVRRDSAYTYEYFIALSTLNGTTTTYPHPAIQLGAGAGGSGNISNRMISSSDPRVTYNANDRLISFRNAPAVADYNIVIEFTDDERSNNGANIYLVTVSIVAHNDLVNIGLTDLSGNEINGNVIRTTLLDAADPRSRIANIEILNITVGTLVEDPNRPSSLEYDSNTDRDGGAIFAPDNQFAGGIIDYANEVVRHSLFVLVTDNESGVTLSYVILAELGFDTPVPSPLERITTFADVTSNIRYAYSGDHDNGISVRVNYPYDGNWAAGSTDAQRAFINIGGEISVFLDPADQSIFAYDGTDGVIRVVSETAPTETTDAYIFNYVPYSSAKGLNGITNTVTFLGVEDIGGVTDEVALAAPAGGVVRRSSAYNYRYFIALSTLNGITTYPHPAIQLGTGAGGSGNISNRMISSSDPLVTYNANDRIISFRSAPAVEDYNIVIEFTDNERSNNGANNYLVTVSIVANNDLINIDLSTPSGDDIVGNVIRTTLLNAAAPRGYIASVGLFNTTDGTLTEDPNRPSSLEYDSNTDRDGGAIFAPDNQFAGGIIDYANEVVRHSLFVLATDNELGVTLSYEIFAELGFDIPVPSPLGGTPAFEDTANGIRYAYSGDHDNGISIRVNYPYDGNWAAGSTDVQRSFINIGGEISVFLDPADQSIFAHDETDGVIRVVSETAPTETTDAYILNYVPYSSVKGLNGITNTITFLAVEDIGGVTDEVALAAPAGGIVRRDSAYNYEYFIALSTLNGTTTTYPHPAIQLGAGAGGSGNISNRMISSSDPRVTYNANDRLISFRNAPAVADYNIVIEFTDDERSNNGANIYLVTVSIVAHNDLVDVGLSDLSGNEINGNVIRTTLLDAADPRGHIANIEVLNITVGTLVEDPNRPSSLEYDSNTDRDGGAIFVPDNQFAGGIIDYANEVVRHSLFVLATDNESGVTLSYVILAELGFDTPVPSPLGGITTFADAASNVRYRYNGDHDSGISIRVNYPYDGNWAAGSTDTQRAFINIGGEISVFLDSTNQTIFAHDGTDGVIRVVSETPPTETTDSYIFNYVPYSSAKGLNGITNTITFLGVEDIGGVTDEIAADAPTGNIVQRSGVYNYGYFIALSTLGGITTNYPHNAIQLGGGDGGSGNISSSMESRSDSRVVYNPTTRIISFASAPAVANYEMVIRFTDDEASTNEAVDYLVTVNILANNDLVDIALGPVGISTAINSNVISTPLLDVTDPRGHIANITLLNVPANGVLEVDTSKPSSLEYDRTDITMGRIFSPDNQFAGGIIDYANEVVRHSIFINGIDNDMGLTISYEIRALLSFETPVPAPLEQIAAFANPASNIRYAYSGDHDNGISIRVNYPYNGNWAAGSTDAQRSFINIGGEVSVFLDGANQAVFAHDETDGVIRVVSETAPTETTDAYILNYVPYSSVKGLNGITNTITFLAVEDIGGVTDEVALAAPSGSIVRRDSAYNYEYFIALSTLNGITTTYPHPAIQLGAGAGGSGNISNRMISSSDPRVTYNANDRLISFRNAPAVADYNIVIEFTDDERSNNGANIYLVTVSIVAHNDLVDVGLSDLSGNEINGNVIRTTLLDAADPRGHIANIEVLNITVGTLVEDPNRPSSLEYDSNADRDGGAIFAPDNQFAGGIIDYANEVVRHSLFVLATDNESGVTLSYVILAELGFDTPVPSPLGGIATFADAASNVRYRYNGDHDSGISIRVNYPYDGNWAAGSTDTQRAFINIGGEISVFLDSTNQTIFAHDGTDGVIRVVSETPPTETTDSYIFNYVPYSSAKGLNGITNTITFLGVEDIGGVTDEIAADAPTGNIVQRSGVYNYGYFIALSTLGGITTNYPHNAIQLGGGDGGSGNISSSMESRSDSRVVYNPTTRIISFASAPAVANYEMVIRFTDDEASTNEAVDYLVTVNILANNDLVDIALGPVGISTAINSNVISTPLLDVTDPRGHIANITLLNVPANGVLEVDTSKPSSLEYDRTDITMGRIFSPDNQFAGGIIDYANEVVRHSIFINGIDNDMGLTISYEIRALLSFETPVPAPLEQIAAFANPASNIRYAYSGDHDNGISIRVNYPYNGNWAAGSTDAQRSFINIGGEVSVFLDGANQAVFAYDDTDGVIRVVSETAPAETTAPYTFNYVPYSSAKGLNGITNSITFLGVEDIGGVTDEVATDAPIGSIVRRSGAYTYEYFIALSTLTGPLASNFYPHNAIQLGGGDGGSGNISSSMESRSDSRVVYNPATRIISFASAPAVANYEMVIRFTDDEASTNEAVDYLVTVNILANNDLVDLILDPVGVSTEVNDNVISTPLLDVSDPRGHIANITLSNFTANGTLIVDTSRPGSLEYDQTDITMGRIFSPDNQFAGGIIDYTNEVVRHSIFVNAIDNEISITLSYVILAELGFDTPVPSPLGGTPAFEDTVNGIRYRYNGDHDNGISVRVNYPYDGNWAAGSTDTQRAFINIGGEISVFLDSTNQTIFAHDETDGVIRVVSETPPADTTDAYIFNYVPYSSAKGLNGITNTITFLGVEDIGGVTDEVALAAPAGGVVRRSSAYNYRYFIALSTLNGITTYPHPAIQLGTGAGGSGNISNRMISSSDPLVTYNANDRIISFRSAPAVEDYNIVIEFTDNERSNNGANNYLVTVSIVANNDLINIDLSTPSGDDIVGNVIRTTLLNAAAPRGYIASVGLFNTTDGTLIEDPNRPSSLEYDSNTDRDGGAIFSPDNQFAGGIIDYANEVVRHSLFVLATDNELGVTLSYEIFAELGFDIPVPSSLEEISTFANPASDIRYAYSGDHDNGISIRVNYSYDGNWAAGSTDVQRSFINIGGEISVFLDTANQAVFVYDGTDGVIRLVSETPPADTAAPYTFNYVPYNSAKGLTGITNSITFLGVEDIGGVTDEVAADAPTGNIVQRSGAYNYGYFIALSTLNGITNYPHNAIQLGGGDGGSGNISSSMESRSDSRVVYNPTTRIISFASAPAVANYEMVIRFTDDEASTNEAVDYLVTVNITANNDLVEIGLTDTNGVTVVGNTYSTELLDIAAPATHILNVSLADVTNGNLVFATGSLEYEVVDTLSGRILLPTDLLSGDGVTIDYENEVVRHSIVLLATDTDGGFTDIPRIIYVLLTFATPTGNPASTENTYAINGRRYTYDDSGNGISIRINYTGDAWVDNNLVAGNILGLGEADIDFGASGGATDAVFDRVSGAVRITAAQAPESTTQEYTFTYFPRNDVKGLVGVTNTVTVVAVPDVGATEQLSDLPYVDGASGQYRFIIPIALTATADVRNEPIVTYTPSGGNGASYESRTVGDFPSVLSYDPNSYGLSLSRLLNDSSPEIGTTLTVKIEFSEINAGVEAASFTSTVTIEPTTVILDVFLTEPTSTDELTNYSPIEPLPNEATNVTRRHLANVRFIDRSISTRTSKLAGSLEYDAINERVYLPAGDLIGNGVVDFVNDVVRHSIVILAENLDAGTQRQLSYNIDFSFEQPGVMLENNNTNYPNSGLNIDYQTTGFPVGAANTIIPDIKTGSVGVQVNYPNGQTSYTPNSNDNASYVVIDEVATRESSTGFRVLNDAGGFVDSRTLADGVSVLIRVGDADDFISVFNDSGSIRLVANTTPDDVSQPFDVRIQPYNHVTGLVGQTVTVRINLVEDIIAASSPVDSELVRAVLIGNDSPYRYIVSRAQSVGGTGAVINIVGDGGTGIYESRVINRTPKLGYEASTHQVTYTSIPAIGDIDVITIGIRDSNPSVGARNEYTIALTIVAVRSRFNFSFNDVSGNIIAGNILELNLAEVSGNQIIATIAIGNGLRPLALSRQLPNGFTFGTDNVRDVILPSDISEASTADAANGFLEYVYRALFSYSGPSGTAFGRVTLTVRLNYPRLEVSAIPRGANYDSTTNPAYAGEEHIDFEIFQDRKHLELDYRDSFWELLQTTGVANFADHRNPVLFDVSGGSGQGDRDTRRVEFISITPALTGDYAIREFTNGNISNSFGYYHGINNQSTSGESGLGEFASGRRLAFYIPATRAIGIPPYLGPYTLSLRAFDNNIRTTITTSYTFVVTSTVIIEPPTVTLDVFITEATSTNEISTTVIENLPDGATNVARRHLANVRFRDSTINRETRKLREDLEYDAINERIYLPAGDLIGTGVVDFVNDVVKHSIVILAEDVDTETQRQLFYHIDFSFEQPGVRLENNNTNYPNSGLNIGYRTTGFPLGVTNTIIPDIKIGRVGVQIHYPNGQTSYTPNSNDNASYVVIDEVATRESSTGFRVLNDAGGFVDSRVLADGAGELIRVGDEDDFIRVFNDSGSIRLVANKTPDDISQPFDVRIQPYNHVTGLVGQTLTVRINFVEDIVATSSLVDSGLVLLDGSNGNYNYIVSNAALADANGGTGAVIDIVGDGGTGTYVSRVINRTPNLGYDASAHQVTYTSVPTIGDMDVITIGIRDSNPSVGARNEYTIALTIIAVRNLLEFAYNDVSGNRIGNNILELNLADVSGDQIVATIVIGARYTMHSLSRQLPNGFPSGVGGELRVILPSDLADASTADAANGSLEYVYRALFSFGSRFRRTFGRATLTVRLNYPRLDVSAIPRGANYDSTTNPAYAGEEHIDFEIFQDRKHLELEYRDSFWELLQTTGVANFADHRNPVLFDVSGGSGQGDRDSRRVEFISITPAPTSDYAIREFTNGSISDSFGYYHGINNQSTSGESGLGEFASGRRLAFYIPATRAVGIPAYLGPYTLSLRAFDNNVRATITTSYTFTAIRAVQEVGRDLTPWIYEDSNNLDEFKYVLLGATRSLPEDLIRPLAGGGIETDDSAVIAPPPSLPFVPVGQGKLDLSASIFRLRVESTTSPPVGRDTVNMRLTNQDTSFSRTHLNLNDIINIVDTPIDGRFFVISPEG